MSLPFGLATFRPIPIMPSFGAFSPLVQFHRPCERLALNPFISFHVPIARLSIMPRLNIWIMLCGFVMGFHCDQAILEPKIWFVEFVERIDDTKTGVGAQRGRGVHQAYVAELAAKAVEEPKSPTSVSESGQQHSISTQNSASTSSTTSSFLTKHFAKRYFILKVRCPPSMPG